MSPDGTLPALLKRLYRYEQNWNRQVEPSEPLVGLVRDAIAALTAAEATREKLQADYRVLEQMADTLGAQRTVAMGIAADRLADLKKALRERDLAIAHDRQPYPTAEAYEAVCKALETHRNRADQAEATRLQVEQELRQQYTWWGLSCLGQGGVISLGLALLLGALALVLCCGSKVRGRLFEQQRKVYFHAVDKSHSSSFSDSSQFTEMLGGGLLHRIDVAQLAEEHQAEGSIGIKAHLRTRANWSDTDESLPVATWAQRLNQRPRSQLPVNVVLNRLQSDRQRGVVGNLEANAPQLYIRRFVGGHLDHGDRFAVNLADVNPLLIEQFKLAIVGFGERYGRIGVAPSFERLPSDHAASKSQDDECGIHLHYRPVTFWRGVVAVLCLISAFGIAITGADRNWRWWWVPSFSLIACGFTLIFQQA